MENEPAKRKSLLSKASIVVLLVLLLGILETITGFITQKHKQPPGTKDQTKMQKKENVTDEEKRILDCAKKLDQGSDLSQLDPNNKDLQDCLFIGCGNFFR